MAERTVGPHDFRLQTCGLDTHRRGPNYARLDTPWNAFTADGSKLVCTLWVDLIVDVHDPELGRARRFVKMGGRSRRWKGDYERGIYQVVKYRAVLAAQALADCLDVQPEIRVVLLLERELPAVYRALAAQLGVTVIENVSPRHFDRG
ncbi:hypothetical protein [Piscinibacter sp.]|uniref:hypothetical protein n=1 Tax=Piscinibacter sp. TaxID=1903157 RepID=UPI0035B4F595